MERRARHGAVQILIAVGPSDCGRVLPEFNKIAVKGVARRATEELRQGVGNFPCSFMLADHVGLVRRGL